MPGPLLCAKPGVTLAAPRMSQNYKETLNLPKTDFPMKANLATREPEAGTPEHAKWVEKLERVTNRAEVLVEKHRHGATRSIDLMFEGQYTRFSNLAEDQT